MSDRINEAIREYDRKLRKFLAEASEEDYVVCPSARRVTPQMCKDVGIDSITDICTECGREVTRSNVETKAKIMCESCFKGVYRGGKNQRFRGGETN